MKAEFVGIPGVDGRRVLMIKPPGDAARTEKEFTRWLQEFSRRMIRAHCGHVDLIPVLTEADEICVRTDPLDALTYDLVRGAL